MIILESFFLFPSLVKEGLGAVVLRAGGQLILYVILLDNKEYDQERTNYFESLEIKVIRFWNNEINNNLEGVLMKIKEELDD